MLQFKAKWGGKLKCFAEKKSFQFLLKGSGVAGGANVDRKIIILHGII